MEEERKEFVLVCCIIYWVTIIVQTAIGNDHCIRDSREEQTVPYDYTLK